MKKLLPLLGSVLIIATLLFFFDWKRLETYKDRFRMAPFIIGVCFYIFSLILRSFRYRFIFPLLWPCRIGWLRGFEYTNVGTFANHILPFRLGEAVFVFLGKKWWEMPTSVSIVTLLAVRIYDITTIMVIFLCTALLVKPEIPVAVFFSAAALIIFLLVCTAYLDFSLNVFIHLIKQSTKIFSPKIKEKTTKLINVFEKTRIESTKLRSGRTIAVLMLLSFGTWCCMIIFFQKMAGALGIELGYDTVILGSFGASLASFLPINLMGNIGSLEAGWTLGFMAMGLTISDATASGLLMHLVAIIIVGTSAGISIAHPKAFYQQIRKRPVETHE